VTLDDVATTTTKDFVPCISTRQKNPHCQGAIRPISGSQRRIVQTVEKIQITSTAPPACVGVLNISLSGKLRTLNRRVIEIDDPEIELEVFWGDGQDKPTQAFWLWSQDGTPLVWLIAGQA
jgi:hypothetical protein